MNDCYKTVKGLLSESEYLNAEIRINNQNSVTYFTSIYQRYKRSFYTHISNLFAKMSPASGKLVLYVFTVHESWYELDYREFPLYGIIHQIAKRIKCAAGS